MFPSLRLLKFAMVAGTIVWIRYNSLVKTRLQKRIIELEAEIKILEKKLSFEHGVKEKLSDCYDRLERMLTRGNKEQ